MNAASTQARSVRSTTAGFVRSLVIISKLSDMCSQRDSDWTKVSHSSSPFLIKLFAKVKYWKPSRSVKDCCKNRVKGKKKEVKNIASTCKACLITLTEVRWKCLLLPLLMPQILWKHVGALFLSIFFFSCLYWEYLHAYTHPVSNLLFMVYI